MSQDSLLPRRQVLARRRRYGRVKVGSSLLDDDECDDVGSPPTSAPGVLWDARLSRMRPTDSSNERLHQGAVAGRPFIRHPLHHTQCLQPLAFGCTGCGSVFSPWHLRAPDAGSHCLMSYAMNAFIGVLGSTVCARAGAEITD